MKPIYTRGILLCSHKKKRTGITFEVPRASLMTAVNYQIFDDLLIGNFMKTTLHHCDSLYPNFSPTVAKYADNGRAQTESELCRYFYSYCRRAPLDFMRHILEEKVEHAFRRVVPRNSRIFQAARKAYFWRT